MRGPHLLCASFWFRLRVRGKFSEAEVYLREALEASRRVLGEEHPDTLISINNLGGLLLAQGKLAEVMTLLAPVEPAARKAFTGPIPRRLATPLMNLGKARAGLAKNPTDFATAEANLLEAHSIYLKAPGPTPTDARDCTQALADLYAAWDKIESGRGYDTKSAEWKVNLEASQPPATAPSAIKP